MPHMKASKDGEDPALANNSDGEQGGKEEPLESNKLLSLAATASKHAPPVEAPEESQVDAEAYPNAANRDPSKVTPSPYGTVPPRGYEHLPYYNYDSHPPPPPPYPMYDRNRVVYGAGARRLFPSPIRYNRTKSEEEDDDSKGQNPDHSAPRSDGYRFHAPPHPPIARPPFGPPVMHPYPPYPPRPYSYEQQYSRQQAADHAPPSPSKKRPSSHEEETATKRWKPAHDDKHVGGKEMQKEDGNRASHESSPSSTVRGEEGEPSKQRVISPSSSVEHATGKSQDDESACGANHEKRSRSETSEGPQSGPARFPPHPPTADSRYGSAPYQPPYYQSGPGMYGYPPPPPPSYPDGSHHHGWRMPPSGSFPPPHGAASPYAHTYPPRGYGHPTMPPRSYPPRGMNLEKPVDRKSSGTPTQQTSAQNVGAPKIKSVAEWQRATLATGKAPSANRCMPLKAPIPSKYWGEAEKAKGAPIPDFHQLVNFPDYLNKMRPNGSEAPSSDNDGKRPCVMCGKHRICSASTANLGGNVLRRSKKPDTTDDADDADSNHIIPRQNKGLCTACDVTVWVFVESGLEIKWCKGCKNFRPWAAFGDKGLATKCVRCRDRQREKYALQKDELRQRRLRMNSKQENKCENGQHEIAAARGLRDLMAASAAI